jgi:fructose-bisphosphate aldolase class II
MIATAEQYAGMLDAAPAGGYALAAVNVTSSETLNGAMRGFADAGADGIVQITAGAAEFLSGGAVRDMALGARALAQYARVVAERYRCSSPCTPIRRRRSVSTRSCGR